MTSLFDEGPLSVGSSPADMKHIYIAFSLLSLLCIPDAFADVRSFTSVDGKSIVAEVVGFEGRAVKLKMGETIYQVPVSKLSEPDKEYLKAWLKDNIPYAFRFSVFEKEGASPLTSGQGGESPSLSGRGNQESTDVSHYIATITNDSGVELEDVELQYRVFIKRTVRMGFSGTNKSTYQAGGLTKITSLPAGRGTSVPTASIVLTDSSSKSTMRTTITYTNGGSTSFTETKKNRDRLEPMGVWFRLYHKGKLVGEYKDLHDDVANSNPTWEESTNWIGRVEFDPNQ